MKTMKEQMRELAQVALDEIECASWDIEASTHENGKLEDAQKACTDAALAIKKLKKLLAT